MMPLQLKNPEQSLVRLTSFAKAFVENLYNVELFLIKAHGKLEKFTVKRRVERNNLKIMIEKSAMNFLIRVLKILV